jgi:hypothetical protein
LARRRISKTRQKLEQEKKSLCFQALVVLAALLRTKLSTEVVHKGGVGKFTFPADAAFLRMPGYPL